MSAGITSRTPPRPRTQASRGSWTTLSPPRSTEALCRPRPISERTHGGSRPITTPPKLVVAPSTRRSAAICSPSPIARAILDEELDRCPPGAARAPLLYELGRVELWGVDWRGSGEHLRAALGEIDEDDHALRAHAELQLAQMFQLIGDEPRSIAEHATRAAESAQAVGDDAVLAEALALRGRAEAQLGMDATRVIDRARALESTTVALSTIDRPSDDLAEVRDWHDELGAALTTLRGIVRDAEERGEEASVAWTLGRTAMLRCALGEPDAALRDATRAYDFTADSHRPQNEAVMLGVIASIEAYRGDDAQARIAAARALEVAQTSGAGRPDRLVRSALGMLELSLGDAPAAHRQLEPLVARTRAAGIGEPGAMRFVSDEVEALISIGDLESADELLGWYEGCARRLDRQSALAASGRCRGLLASGSGDAQAACALLADTIDRYADVALPLDRARTVLALGLVERRLQRKRAARGTLEEALSTFEGVGAVMPEPAVADTPAGMRYDGGPDEGTRGLMNAGPAPLVRYDGGPDEGGHGIRHPSAVSVPPASARYDGGPEEGTRGVPFTSATSTTAAGVRFDGGPEEGSRGLGR